MLTPLYLKGNDDDDDGIIQKNGMLPPLYLKGTEDDDDIIKKTARGCPHI